MNLKYMIGGLPQHLHMIGNLNFSKLFHENPKLKLFVTSKKISLVETIDREGGGMKIRFEAFGAATALTPPNQSAPPATSAATAQAAAAPPSPNSGPPSAATSPDSEAAAWEAADKSGAPAAFLEFYRNFPASPHIKTTIGTLRGRYWFKIPVPFANDKQRRNGVLVTVRDSNVAMNLSLADAKLLKVIGVSPAVPGAAPKTQGQTFNYVYMEVTSGAVVVDNLSIAPKDSLNSTIILSADGTRLLAWDLSKATSAPQPSSQPTMIKRADGKYLCGAECPAPP
jgi:hypothetical protein